MQLRDSCSTRIFLHLFMKTSSAPWDFHPTWTARVSGIGDHEIPRSA
jgi:hypothetical protein